MKPLTLLAALAAALTPALSAHAQQVGPLAEATAEAARTAEDEGGTFTFQFENDFFSDTDRHFTHGTKLSYVTAERTPEETEQMVQRTMASLWHWNQREDCTPPNTRSFASTSRRWTIPFASATPMRPWRERNF